MIVTLIMPDLENVSIHVGPGDTTINDNIISCELGPEIGRLPDVVFHDEFPCVHISYGEKVHANMEFTTINYDK